MLNAPCSKLPAPQHARQDSKELQISREKLSPDEHALHNPVHFSIDSSLGDADLVAILSSWPTLPEATRRAILSLVRNRSIN